MGGVVYNQALVLLVGWGRYGWGRYIIRHLYCWWGGEGMDGGGI